MFTVKQFNFIFSLNYEDYEVYNFHQTKPRFDLVARIIQYQNVWLKTANFEQDFCDSAMAAISVPAEDFQKVL